MMGLVSLPVMASRVGATRADQPLFVLRMLARQDLRDPQNIRVGLRQRHSRLQPAVHAERPLLTRRVGSQRERNPDIDLGEVADFDLGREHAGHGRRTPIEHQCLPDDRWIAVQLPIPIAVADDDLTRGAGCVRSVSEGAAHVQLRAPEVDQVRGHAARLQATRVTAPREHHTAPRRRRERIERRELRPVVQELRNRERSAIPAAMRVHGEHPAEVSGDFSGSGRSSRMLAKVKMTVLAPIARASVITTTAENVGWRRTFARRISDLEEACASSVSAVV
jgi:hypothetical protein